MSSALDTGPVAVTENECPAITQTKLSTLIPFKQDNSEELVRTLKSFLPLV